MDTEIKAESWELYDMSEAKQEIMHREEPRAVATNAAVTPMKMLEMAVQQGADLDRLEKLMELQERWEKNEARKAFVAALNAFKAAPPTLTKNKHVDFTTQKGRTQYDHATLDHVSEQIGKALAAHGLSHRWDVEQLDGGQIRVTCVLTHDAGHSERVPMQSGADQSGGKNNIQAIGSTVTYLQRYTLLAATGMAVKDQDDDGKGSAAQGVETISEKQASTLADMLAATETPEARFLRWVFAGQPPKDVALSDIPAARYDECIAKLRAKQQKGGSQ
ncbi:MAG TPA: ERF family protein [Gammaproteobacteria bacterium]|nr:ERF family protein [Gammaproteobacteria bacterium]